MNMDVAITACLLSLTKWTLVVIPVIYALVRQWRLARGAGGVMNGQADRSGIMPAIPTFMKAIDDPPR